mgnify:FL=1|tara:strand:+ start:1974 stop:2777 length:804 start_codon:yes stop_codon:yes gene_type:complete
MIKVIAEIGWNHMGDLALAKRMINEASENGAHYAKFQTWSVSRLKPGPWDEDGRRQIYEKAELSYDDHVFLMGECKNAGIIFMSSVFSIPDAELLKKVGCTSVKIPSFESRNHELIDFCAKNFNLVVMSTGTSTIDEIAKSVDYLKKANEWFLLHCVSVYPCDYGIANLGKMAKLTSFTDEVGYSDHIQGVESAKIAIMNGALMIEKHFTVDRELPGRDNKFAILPEELKDLTQFIHRIDLMQCGDGFGYDEKETESRELYTGRFDA